MTWTYRQRTGLLIHNGKILGAGYSGHGKGVNNPSMEWAGSRGPIPAGRWTISGDATHRHKKGPMVMELTPVSHVAYYRDHFLIHGDSKEHPGQRVASEGCIILSPHLRKRILHSKDTELVVEP